MKFVKYFSALTILAGIFLTTCVDIYELEKYQSPKWLEGKLYTQISTREDLSTFGKCLELTGYDTLLNISGSYTVFAPSNDAFNQFFNENPEYASDVTNIPYDELLRIVRFHIIQNAWSKAQLQKLDIGGWIDPSDPDSEPNAYKRQTLLKDPNTKYWVKYSKDLYSIVDSTQANDYRIAITRSRKYVPIFFREFFGLNDLSSSDYQFYFDRPFEGNNIYYGGAKLGDEEIFAENGFIYNIDRVLIPYLNAEQFMKKEYLGESYNTFLDLIYLFPRFAYNHEETANQTAARQGKSYDSLFNLTFPGLPFNINEELTGPNLSISDYTYVSHNGMLLPTDAAFQIFLDEIVTVNSGYPHWRRFEDVPDDIKLIIVKTHLTNKPVYETNIVNGFLNSDGDLIQIDPSTVIRKEFGSNCTFIGLNKTIVPKAFSSVTGPIYLRPGYFTFMKAMQKTKVLPALTRQDAEYSFFAIPDGDMQEDSSLLFFWDDRELNRYNFKSFNRSSERMDTQQPNVLTKRILNQVGTSLPTGFANKEFIETLGGNFIIWNNVDQTVRGARPNVWGWQGDSAVTVIPVQLPEPADNGITYTVPHWFRNSTTQFFGGMSGHPHFRDLLEKAGLYNPKSYEFSFYVEGEFYTIFIPSEEALENYGADMLPKAELEKFLRYHFIRGERIFTDGKKQWKEYETLRLDETSSDFSTVYSTVNIRPSPDLIEILDASGNPYVSVAESPNSTNIMIVTDTDDESESETDFITTVVIHEIDEVLVKQ